MRMFSGSGKFIFLLLIVYFLSRLFNLTILPIFTDESIYIYWAKVIEATHSQWFISLTDGKPPLLVWTTAFFLTVLPDAWYLVAGRLPAVIAGAFSVFFIFKLSELLFANRIVAIAAGVLYIIFPFTLIYDRMALYDPLLQATLLSSTYFAIKTSKRLEIKYAALWGLSMGLAYLSKPTALMFVGLLPLIYLLFTKEKLMKQWKRILGLAVLAVVIAEVINNLQRLSSVYFMAGQKNAQFQQPIDELLKDPFALTFSNLQGFYTWILGYYTLPILLLGIIGLVVLLFTKFRIGVLLLSLWLIPVVALATIGREIFPRYILFTTPYFLISLAYLFSKAISYSGRKWWVVGLTTLLLVLPLLRTDYFVLTAPEKADLPETDYDQLVATHPSGYGLNEIYNYLNERLASGQKITLVTQGTFGLYPYAFDLEYWGDPNINILPRWPLDKIDEEIQQASNDTDVIILLKEHESIPETLPLRLIMKVEKPGGQYPILITELQ